MNGEERHRETLEREERLTTAFKEAHGAPPSTNDTIDAEGRRWQYGDGIGWWVLPTWFGSVGTLISRSPLDDSEGLQQIVNAISPARWQEITKFHFTVEFYAYAESQDEASALIGTKVTLVEERLVDLGAKVSGLSAPAPRRPPKPHPTELVAYEDN